MKALAQHLGGAARQLGFVKARLLIADGICRDSVARRQQVGGIDAAREEALFIGQLRVAALLGENFVDDRLDLLGVFIGSLAVVRLKHRAEIAVQRDGLAVPLRVVAGQQLENALVEGLGADGVAVEQVLLQHALVECFFDARVGGDLVDVARAEQLSLHGGVEHLLLSHLIADDKELLQLRVIQGDGEHAVEVFRHARLPCGIGGFEDGFLARLAAERGVNGKRLAERFPVADIAAEIADLNMVG